MRRLLGLAFIGLAIAMAGSTTALAQHQLRLGLQATGTAKWELAAMTELGIDGKHALGLEVRDLADSRAGQIALQAGEVDVILSDFVWVSLQRHREGEMTMVPHSLTVGGVMVDPAAGIGSVADLKGHALAVSGSPVDKSFVILSAYYAKLTGGTLATDADVRFGAPPLVNELLAAGRADAALNLWNWNSRARIAGKVELISVPAMLAGLGLEHTPPLLGWTFREPVDDAKADAIRAFLDASFETKQVLAADDNVWDRIRPAMNVGDDDRLFAQLRDDYRAGIVAQYAPEDIEAAREAFALMARFGGPDVVGDATDLADGTFWKGYRHSR